MGRVRFAAPAVRFGLAPPRGIGHSADPCAACAEGSNAIQSESRKQTARIRRRINSNPVRKDRSTFSGG
jgi:hypothetical protein